MPDSQLPAYELGRKLSSLIEYFSKTGVERHFILMIESILDDEMLPYNIYPVLVHSLEKYLHLYVGTFS